MSVAKEAELVSSIRTAYPAIRDALAGAPGVVITEDGTSAVSDLVALCHGPLELALAGLDGVVPEVRACPQTRTVTATVTDHADMLLLSAIFTVENWWARAFSQEDSSYDGILDATDTVVVLDLADNKPDALVRRLIGDGYVVSTVEDDPSCSLERVFGGAAVVSPFPIHRPVALYRFMEGDTPRTIFELDGSERTEHRRAERICKVPGTIRPFLATTTKAQTTAILSALSSTL